MEIQWFERKFSFSYKENIFPSIIERLDGTAIRLNHKINQIQEEIWTIQPDGRWSIQENVGHLIDLEPLWYGRLDDILEEKKYMRSADLENRKTHLANHNGEKMSVLLEKF